MFQIYKYVIKGREELTSCSSLIHSHMFPLLDVFINKLGISHLDSDVYCHSGSWEHNDISVRFRAYLSI